MVILPRLAISVPNMRIVKYYNNLRCLREGQWCRRVACTEKFACCHAGEHPETHFGGLRCVCGNRIIVRAGRI